MRIKLQKIKRDSNEDKAPKNKNSKDEVFDTKIPLALLNPVKLWDEMSHFKYRESNGYDKEQGSEFSCF